MGIEYRLRFVAPDVESAAVVLRCLPGAREGAPPGRRFELDAGTGGPQALVELEPGGAYFRDHCGGAGRALLGEVVARLAGAFGPVTVEEL
jgi:hypothetical protein